MSFDPDSAQSLSRPLNPDASGAEQPVPPIEPAEGEQWVRICNLKSAI
jgi:hypothetical protein